MAEHSWPRAIDLLFDLVACELFWVIDEQTDDLCVVVAFVPKFGREVVVAPNLFRNRTWSHQVLLALSVELLLD